MKGDLTIECREKDMYSYFEKRLFSKVAWVYS